MAIGHAGRRRGRLGALRVGVQGGRYRPVKGGSPGRAVQAGIRGKRLCQAASCRCFKSKSAIPSFQSPTYTCPSPMSGVINFAPVGQAWQCPQN